MEREGVFAEGRGGNLVLLVHGWQGEHSSVPLFKAALRAHQFVSPNSCVLFVSWDPQGAQDAYAQAARYSVRLDLGMFLVHVRPVNTTLHCVGHELGAHACAALCRQWRNLTGGHCSRIVALSPSYTAFDASPALSKHRLSRLDARYVVALVADDFLSHVGDYHEYLSSSGASGCREGSWSSKCVGPFCENISIADRLDRENNVAVSCNSLLTVIMFITFLDRKHLPLIRSPPAYPGVGLGPQGLTPSLWSSVVSSKDYTYPDYFDSRVVPYKHGWFPDYVAGAMVVVVTDREDGVDIDQALSTYSARVRQYRVTAGFLRAYFITGVTIFCSEMPYIVRFLGDSSFYTPEGRYASPAFSTESLTCRRSRVSTSRSAFYCEVPSRGKKVPHFRAGLAPRTDPLPPLEGCLAAVHPSDLLSRSETLTVAVGAKLLLPLDFSPFPFVELSMYVNDTSFPLVTYFDVCESVPPNVEIRLDGERHAVMRFQHPGSYTLKLYTVYDVTTFSVSVSLDEEREDAVVSYSGESDASGDEDDEEEEEECSGVEWARDGGVLRVPADLEESVLDPPTIAFLAVSALAIVLVVVAGAAYAYVSRREPMPESLSLTRYTRKEWGDGDRRVDGESDRLETAA